MSRGSNSSLEPGAGRPYSEGHPCSTPCSPCSLPSTPHKYKKGDVVSTPSGIFKVPSGYLQCWALSKSMLLRFRHSYSSFFLRGEARSVPWLYRYSLNREAKRTYTVLFMLFRCSASYKYPVL